MTKADKMFKELSWFLVEDASELFPIFNDYYDKDDIVYEFWLNGQVTCRLYFGQNSGENVYGYAHLRGICVEENAKHHLAVHEKMKELGWIE